MKSFKEFLCHITESFSCFIDGFPVFVNPAKKEISELYRPSTYKMVRFLSIAPEKKVFVWDAEHFIHITGFDFLQKEGKINKSLSFFDPLSIFPGVARIESGNLIYESSDEYDQYIDEYEKPFNRWKTGALKKAGFLRGNSLAAARNHSFLNRYIKEFDEVNPFLVIHELLTKNEKEL